MAEESNVDKQLVVFDLSDEAYGIDIGAVRSIIRMQEITNVPRAPEFVDGVINLRGKVIPVVDLHRRFGLPSTEQTKDSRVVAVDINGQDIGMVVDAVTEVMRIPVSSVEPPSSVIITDDSDYLMGIAKVDDRLIILLELERVFSEEDRAALASASPVGAAAG